MQSVIHFSSDHVGERKVAKSSILTRLARTVKMAASVAPKLSMTRVGLSGWAAARRVTQSTR